MVDPLQALFFVIMFLVLQQIEGNLIYPKVVRFSLGAPPMCALAADALRRFFVRFVDTLLYFPLVSFIYALFRGVFFKSLNQNQSYFLIFF